MPEWAEAMTRQQLYGVLLVMVPQQQPHMEVCRFLVMSLLINHAAQQHPTASDSSSREAAPLHHLLLQLLRTSLQKGQPQCVPKFVGALAALPPVMQPGKCFHVRVATFITLMLVC
jgi:hypothetical protein